MAGQANAFALGIDGNGIVGKVGTHHLGDAAQAAFGAVVGRRQLQRRAVGASQCEAHGGEGNGNALDHITGR